MMHSYTKLLIFTDLDGTLLDYHTYSFDAARPALKRIEELDIPLVIVSSKTRSEIEVLIKSFPIKPRVFIVENCGALFFQRDMALGQKFELEAGEPYFILQLGIPYKEVLEGLHATQKECSATIRGFSSMSTQEVSEITGLDLDSAARAKDREFSEPFIFMGTLDEFQCLVQGLGKRGLMCIEGGRFRHALGRYDKGMAVRKTLQLFQDISPEIEWKTIGLGDSPNDFPMLEAVDTAVLVQRYDSTYADYLSGSGRVMIKAPGIGPVGWNRVILELIEGD
jgi:mannosyl-3-phosphoglycerate phosphatase